MSLLYGQQPFVQSKFSLRSDGEDGLDTVLIGSSLWDSLGTNNTRTCVRLEPDTLYGIKDYIVCWAEEAEELDCLAIPPSWPRLYNNIFGTGTLMLRIILQSPFPLQEVILTAHSNHAFDLAKNSPALLESWFSDNWRILRSGATYELDLCAKGEKEALSYRLESATPVRQGYVKAGFTNFVVTYSNGDPLASACSSHPDAIPRDIDAFEIDELFLENSMQHLPPLPAVPMEEKHHGPSSPRRFLPRPVLSNPSEGEDDATIYIRTLDLIGLGVLDGDWLLARGSNSFKQRLVHLRANDQLVERSGVVIGSQILLHNIVYGQTSRREDDKSTWITLHPSELGQAEVSGFPLARCVTVTPIASPLTTDRAFRHLLAQSIRRYFEQRTRLVQQGDVIAVSLDTDGVNLSERIDGKLDEVLVCEFDFRRSRFNHFASFRVSDVVPEGTIPDTDSYSRYMAGEFGCRVDPLVTRVIQEGIEQSSFPCKGIWNIPGDMPSLDSPIPVTTGSTYDKLSQISRVSLVHSSIGYIFHLPILLEGPRGVGKFTIASEVARRLGMHLMELNCYEILAESLSHAEKILALRFKQAVSCAPCMLILKHIEAFVNAMEDVGSGNGYLTILKQCFEMVFPKQPHLRQPILIIGTTCCEPNKLPIPILSHFKHRIRCTVPNDRERRDVLKSVLATVTLSSGVSVNDLANLAAGLIPSDLVDVSISARLSSFRRRVVEPYDFAADAAFIPLTFVDFDTALRKTRASQSAVIGTPSIPKVSWDDVGGLAAVKADILDTIQLPLEHPEVFAGGLKKRSGILLYGPPGTGKTLVAKAVATSYSLNFLSVKGPELLDMYIGESEANVRKIFQKARDAAPCVIFFDELDSIAPKRGIHGDSGGVMDRIVSQLLAELDGVAKMDVQIFVIGATNRPDLLDSALLRPGRFDKMIYLGFSQTKDAQVHILRALTRKFRLDPNLDFLQFVRKCTFGYTGADFYALCSDAMLIAMSRKADEIEKKIGELNGQRRCLKHLYPITPQYYLAEIAAPGEVETIVAESDFDYALQNLVPSVSQAEMEHYADLRGQFLTAHTQQSDLLS